MRAENRGESREDGGEVGIKRFGNSGKEVKVE